MADQTETAIPWYQQKKWVVSAGLACGAGLAFIFLPPVVEEIVPVLFSETTSAPETAEPDLAEPADADPAEAAGTDDDVASEPDVENAPADDGAGSDANSETPPPEGLYELVVINTEEIESEDLVAVVLSAELNLYPVDKTKLREAVEAEIEQFRGTAHTVSVRVFYDRREGSSPAFGAWEWAPEGDWSKAEDGDPNTWDGYEWSEPDLGKFESPDSCDLPGEGELDLTGAYYASPLADTEEPTEAMDEAAEEIGTTVELLTNALSKTSKWAAC